MPFLGTRSKSRRARNSRFSSTASDPLVDQLTLWCEKKFRNHGRWISKHQISTLLICSLVITCLFYPAVGIYLWSSKGGPHVSRRDATSVWKLLSLPFMDSFANSDTIPANSPNDLGMVWDHVKDINAFDVRDADSFSLFQPTDAGLSASSSSPLCESIRVEQVFVTTEDVMAGHGPLYGVLDKRILLSALKLQSAIQAQALESPPQTPSDTVASSFLPTLSNPPHTPALSCIRATQSFPGRLPLQPPQMDVCLTLSPLEFWRMDETWIQNDPSPAESIIASKLNKTMHGIPLSVTTTLAGRWHPFNKHPRAEYLAFTFFLHDQHDHDACTVGRLDASSSSAKRFNSVSISPSHATWLNLLRNVTSGQVNIVPSEQTNAHNLVLQFSPQQPLSGWTSGHILLLTGYIIVVIYITRGLIQMRKVHTRFGLAFSGLIGLIISMIMSTSICALLGIRLTLVPWELLPFVIVVVGSENMFILTNAFVSTPLSLTVPSRSAQGLSKVGGPIAITTLADIMLLGSIAVSVNVDAVKEFCAFAILSLLMDFFLQMTFFITILSIDMQRLELADLLTQGARNSESMKRTQDAQDEENRQSLNRPRAASNNFVQASLRAIWRARTARTASLTLILAFLAGLYLYYGTGYQMQSAEPYTLDPSWNSAVQVADSDPDAWTKSTATFDPYAHLGNVHRPAPWWTSSHSADLWQSLNPKGAHQVRVTVEPWTIVSLKSFGTETKAPPSTQSFAGWALFRPRIRAIVWFSKVVILPISGTTGLLWILLLYLLKDTELLDAQRDKSEADSDEQGANGGVDTATNDLPVQLAVETDLHRADIEHIAQCGGVIVSADTDSIIQVRHADNSRADPHSHQRLANSAKLSSLRLGKDLDTSPITALAMSSSAELIFVGLASGRVCLISLVTLKLLHEAIPADGQSPVQHFLLQHREALNSLEAVAVVSLHRNGRAFEFNCARGTCRSVLQRSPGSTWLAFAVESASLEEESPSPPAMVGAKWNMGGYVAFASSDSSFEVRKLTRPTLGLEMVLELPASQRSHIRAAVLCSVLKQQTGPFEDTDPRIVVVGRTDGCVEAYDVETKKLISCLDLGDGSVSKIRAIQDDEQNACILAVSTNTRVSIVTLGGDMFGQAGLETSPSVPGSISSLGGGSPMRIRPSNGIHLTANNFWAENSNPTTPTSEGPNPFSYPMSSHGNAARLRRSSGHVRDRGTIASESPMNGNWLAPDNGQTAADDRQLRLVGSVPSVRGGFELIHPTRCILGVCRRKQTLFRSNLGTRTLKPQDQSLESEEADRHRWECWMLDLRAEFVIGRGGELVVPRQSINLDSPLPNQPTSEAVGSLSSSKLRFVQNKALNGVTMMGLAFSRLHPVTGLFMEASQVGGLIFGFGGSIGVLSGKLGGLDASRLGGGQRRAKSSGGSVTSNLERNRPW